MTVEVAKIIADALTDSATILGVCAVIVAFIMS